MPHEPGGLLRDAEVASKLDAGYSLGLRCDQEDANRPFPVAQLGPVHDGVGLDGEEFAAVAAVVGHCRVTTRIVHVVRVAMRTAELIWPARFDEPVLSCCIVGKSSRQLSKREVMFCGIHPGSE